jgi:uncharacterized protein YndB with AHSA1/START domain
VIEGDRVIHEVRYPYPPERVWQALTDPAELSAWLMPNDFTLREGAQFRLDARPEHAAPFECEVLEIEPLRRLRTRWVVGGQPTTVTFELRPDGAETVLRVEHDGLPPDEEPKFDGGWNTKFGTDLKLVLDGTRDPGAATRGAEGLISHPANSAAPEA